MPVEKIAAAEIQWRGRIPFSTQFQDIYFSDDADQEVRRVFLGPSQLPKADPSLTVAELGFGSGLNFAVLAEDVLNKQGQRLHFISFEAHPLRHSDWRKIAECFPDYNVYRELAEQPPPLLSGWHRLVFAGGRITLSLYHGPAEEGIKDLLELSNPMVDGWFLDGFAPDRNQDLWRPSLLQTIAKSCKPDATVATFTAAGHVRRALSSVGFEMRRVDQRPHKRESLAGRKPGPSSKPSSPSVAVYGAGISGASVAWHLAKSGCQVHVVDPNGPASGASGMHHTVLHARLLGDGSASADLRSQAFQYASRLATTVLGTAASGVLQLMGPNLDEKKFRRISQQFSAGHVDHASWLRALDGDESHRLSGGLITQPSLYFPWSRTMDLHAFCLKLLDHANINLSTKPSGHEEMRVLCAGTACRDFYPWLELADVGGQLDSYRFAPRSTSIPLVGNGYFIPTHDGAVVGSTYEYRPWPPAEATQHNLELNRQYLPSDAQWLSRTRAVRSIASDRLPVIGKIAEQTWIATGMGSMGTTFGPLAGATIAAQITGHLPPINQAVLNLVAPERFLARQARRGVRHGFSPQTGENR